MRTNGTMFYKEIGENPTKIHGLVHALYFRDNLCYGLQWEVLSICA